MREREFNPLNDMKIKEFYLENYPTDELGIEVSPTATFGGLYQVLQDYTDVYEYIGIGDSIIRERLFEKLAEITGHDYEDLLFLSA
jgi:hypothetical protein